jgi:hypothetical protein
LQERRLQHREEAEKFYRDLASPGVSVRVGMEASGHARWFERLMAESEQFWDGLYAARRKLISNPRGERPTKIAASVVAILILLRTPEHSPWKPLVLSLRTLPEPHCFRGWPGMAKGDRLMRAYFR